jgi:hypothetical protein
MKAEETSEVEQDGHPDGALFELLTGTGKRGRVVLAIEKTKAASMQRGLTSLLGRDKHVHPHVWPGVKKP